MSQNRIVVANRIQYMIYAKTQPEISNALRLKVVQRSLQIVRGMRDNTRYLIRDMIGKL